MGKKIAIIGAGIAGLSAGCYLQMNGYETEIFELHDKPGGICTSWTRKGYTFDGCIHWLVGTKNGSSFNQVWRELGALSGVRCINHGEFTRFENADGKQLVLYNDINRLERHLKELSPSDAAMIEGFCNDIRKLAKIKMPAGEPTNTREMLAFLKILPGMMKLVAMFLKKRKMTMEKFRQGFKDPFLRQSFGQLMETPEFPLIFMLLNLAWISIGDAGYPEGGSLEFARSIEHKYLSLGGKMSYKSRVAEITVENSRVTGLKLEDGSLRPADVVISAADGRSTIFEMLGGRYINDKIKERYRTWKLYDPLVQVSIGVKRDLSGEPHSLRFPLEKPIVVGGVEHSGLSYSHYCFDPTLTPAGKSAVVSYLSTDYDYWEKLYEDREAYKAEKKRIGEEVVEALNRRWPGFKDDVEVVDVASPMTYVRYTANWRGSYEGWLLNAKNSRYMMIGLEKNLPGLEGFYLIGSGCSPAAACRPRPYTLGKSPR